MVPILIQAAALPGGIWLRKPLWTRSFSCILRFLLFSVQIRPTRVIRVLVFTANSREPTIFFQGGNLGILTVLPLSGLFLPVFILKILSILFVLRKS